MLTPVEKHGDVWYKRDDLYAPYGEDWITGGKIRQCRHLVESNLEYIQKECNNTIATAASIHSPQAPIVSKVAEEFGCKSIIGFGNSTVEKALKRKGMAECSNLGSEMIVLSESQGFNNVLYSNLNKLRKERPFFPILFGYAATTNRESIINQIADQVENVDCDVLYVPLGSGITFASILEGMKKYDKKFKVVGIQPFGYDRKTDIHKLCTEPQWEYDYEYVQGKFPYNKLVKRNVGFELDMIYESKAHIIMEEMLDPSKKNCYWVIGNSNFIRG